MDAWENYKGGRYHTLQPTNANMTQIMRYFRSMHETQTNYENVPKSNEQRFVCPHFGHPQNLHHRQTSMSRHVSNHFHNRSQSHHYYNNAMLPTTDLNNYSNIPPQMECAYPQMNQANRSRHSPPPPPLISQAPAQPKRPQLDSMTVMRLGAELGHLIDSAPTMPPTRRYSIVETRNGMYKIPFPQTRIMATDVIDSEEDVFIKKGERVIVHGPSSEDRSKFVICYDKRHIEVPHQYTQRP